MQDLLPLAGTVDQSSLIIFGINADDRREINNTAIADPFPEVDQRQNKRPVLRLGIPVQLIEPEQGQHSFIYETVFNIEKSEHKIAHNDHG
ncbi:hypothetical protein D3C87_1630320 [compost metagenome]